MRVGALAVWMNLLGLALGAPGVGSASAREPADFVVTSLGGEANSWDRRAQHCGALVMAQQLKPFGWRLRVYHDDRQVVKQSGRSVLEALVALGAELVLVSPQVEVADSCMLNNSQSHANHTKYFWALRALSDPSVKRHTSFLVFVVH
jgi:hypothetical protein